MEPHFFLSLTTVLPDPPPRVSFRWPCRRTRVRPVTNSREVAVARWRKVALLRPLLAVMNRAKEETRNLQQQEYDGLRSTLTMEDVESQLPEKPWLIYPNQSWKEVFDLIAALVVLYFCVKTPHCLGFHSDLVEFEAYELAFDAVLLADIVLTFFTVIIDDFQVVDDRWKIAKRYLLTFCLPDVISVFPLYVIRPEFMWLKTFRLLHIGRITTVMQNWERLPGVGWFAEWLDWHTRRHLANMTKFILYLTVTCHCITCLWNYIAVNEGLPSSQTWTRGLPMNLVESYSVSLYWTVVTFSTVGYGDVIPMTNPEYAFAMVVETLGILFFAHLVGNVSSIIRSLDARNSVIHEWRNKLDLWLILLEEARDNQVLPPGLVKAIRGHFAYLWKKDHSLLINNSEFMLRLPPAIRHELTSSLFDKDATHFRLLFHSCEDEFRYAVVTSMVPSRIRPNQPIIHPLAAVSQVYCIKSGSVTVRSQSNEPFATLPAASHFGEDYLLFKDLPLISFSADYKGAELLCVAQTRFEELIARFIDARCYITQRAVVRRRYFRSLIGEEVAVGKDLMVKDRNDDDLEPPEAIVARVSRDINSFSSRDRAELDYLAEQAKPEGTVFKEKALEDMQIAATLLRQMQRQFGVLITQCEKMEERYQEDLGKIASGVEEMAAGRKPSLIGY